MPTKTFAGHVIVGGCVSFTVTVKLQVASGPAPFDAVQVTVVVPAGKKEPDCGLHTTVGAGAPFAVGAKVTTAPH